MKAAYKWISTLVVVAVAFQIGFAGYGAFYAAHKIDKSHSDPKAITTDQFDHGFSAHATGALIVIVSILVLVLVSLIGGFGRWRLGRAGVLALLLILQVILAGIAFAVPVFGFFHALNAFVILAFAGWTARLEWEASRVSAASPAAEPASTA